MHEVAAIRAIVADAVAAARANGTRHVQQVGIVVGVSDHASEEAIRQHFDLLATGTSVEGAELVIDWIAARYRCFDCGARFELAEPGASRNCPRCGGHGLPEEHSDVVALRRLELED